MREQGVVTFRNVREKVARRQLRPATLLSGQAIQGLVLWGWSRHGAITEDGFSAVRSRAGQE